MTSVGNKSYPIEFVSPPTHPVYRVAGTRQPLLGIGFDPFTPGSSFASRFDDPRVTNTHDISGCFRVVYCASDPVAAFAETIQGFIPDRAIPQRPILPKSWGDNRWLGEAVLDQSMRFLDTTSPKTRAVLARDKDIYDCLRNLVAALRATASSTTISNPAQNPPVQKPLNLDISALTGDSPLHRALTKQIALYTYTHPASFAGLKYISHLDPEWVCWAVFFDRLLLSSKVIHTFDTAHPRLLQAASQLGVSI